MQLTEKIQLKHSLQLSSLCHLSKNLYNLANYYVRQELFHLENWLRYHDLWYMLKEKDAFRQLPAQTAQQILRMVDKNWKSFFRSIKHHKKHPERYLGPPKPPLYKRKDGECIVMFTNQQCRNRGDFLYFPKRIQLPPLKTRIKDQLHHVRIIPKGLN